MIRVAMLSFWHVHAPDYAKQVKEHPQTEIVAVWDELPERGQAEAEKLGVEFVASLDDLLQRSDIDAVVCDAPTNMHHEVLMKAARAGKHIFTEKVLAPTLREANDIVNAVKQAGVKLVVSLPRLYDGYTLAIQDVIRSGKLGQLTYARVRLAHGGAIAGWLPAHFFDLEQCRGGALIDLGCHPMYLTRLFLGLPNQVNASYGYQTGKDVEDNAVSVLNYANGSLGVVEAGFITRHTPFSIEIHGQNGSLFYGTPEEKLLVKTNDSPEWTSVSIPDNAPSAFHQWVTHIQNDTTADENIAMAVDLTRLMEASNLSAERNGTVRLDELSS